MTLGFHHQQVTFFNDDARYAMGLPAYERLIHAETFISHTGREIYAVDGTVSLRSHRYSPTVVVAVVVVVVVVL